MTIMKDRTESYAGAIASKHQAIAGELAEKLKAYYTTSQASEKEEAHLTPEVENQFKSLGYIE